MVSYDKSVEILREYPNRKSFIYSLRYNASRRYEGQEICIFSDDICLPSYSKLACIGERVKRARPARELLDEMISRETKFVKFHRILNPHQGFESLADLITFQLILRHRSRDPLPFAQRSFALMGGPMGGLAGACR